MLAPASIGKRIIAFIIDLLIIDIILLTPFSSYFERIMPQVQQIMIEQIPEGFFLAASFIGILALLYFSLLEYYVNATIGMQLLNISVQGTYSFWQCCIRNLYIIPFFPFTLLWIIEPIYLFWHKERLLERLTKTKTVETVIL